MNPAKKRAILFLLSTLYLTSVLLAQPAITLNHKTYYTASKCGLHKSLLRGPNFSKNLSRSYNLLLPNQLS